MVMHERSGWIEAELLPTLSAQFPSHSLNRILIVTEHVETTSADLNDALIHANATYVEPSRLADAQARSSELVFFYNCARFADSKSLQNALRVLTADGLVVVSANSELPTSEIAALSAAFDTFATRIDDADRGFCVYCMNQFEDPKDESKQLGVYWILQQQSQQSQQTTTTTIGGSDDGVTMTRSFLDKTQYTDENIASYEFIFGDEFISPGGAPQNEQILRSFDGLGDEKRLLDIGCGIGGGVFQAAERFGVRVLGCDISANMIAMAIERARKRTAAAKKSSLVSFQIADAVCYRFGDAAFDFIFSRDCVQHIAELETLFANAYRSLRPGGQLLVTMYGKGAGSLTDEFLKYTRDRRYTLRSLPEVLEIARNIGFAHVEGENMTKRFAEILRAERANALQRREEFLKRFSQKKLDDLLASWEQKLQFIAHDNHNWLKIKCKK